MFSSFCSIFGHMSLIIDLHCCSACAEYAKKLSDIAHVARVKSSARLAMKGILAKIKVLLIAIEVF